MESINSTIQRQFPAQTNIFKFAQQLRLYESIRSFDLYQISTGMITNRKLVWKRKEDREREEKIIFFTEKLKNGVISIAEFLEAMACKDVLPAEGYKVFKIHKAFHM